MRNKKDLIVVSAHCPTPEKEEKLFNLILKLQDLRGKFDLLVVSHTPVSKEICGKIDHFYYDSNNDLPVDFDLRYMSWFQNESFYLETSLLNNTTTSVTIARQIRYSINFADFWGYKKIHYMEYDFIYRGDDVVLDINEKLEEYDTVMFEHSLNSGLFASSVYFAFKTVGLEEDSREFDRDKFLDLIRNPHRNLVISGKQERMTNHARMTENLNVILFSKNERRCLFLPSLGIDQSEDSHFNGNLKWAFPIYAADKNCLLFFIDNNLDSPHKIEVVVNKEVQLQLECPPGNWMLRDLSDFEGDKDIEIWVDGSLQKRIEINQFNKDIFIANSYIKFNNPQ